MNEFDAETHTYTIDGRPVPSVTQVLSDLIPGWKASEWYLNRGTAVHACAAMIAKGIEFDYDPLIEGQVTACKRFFAEVKPTVLGIERKVFSVKHGFAGTFDLLCAISGRVMLLDWKASFSQALPFQLAGYAVLHDDVQGNTIIKHGVGVQLNEDGTYRMSEVFDLRRYKQGFLALLSAYNIRRECKVKTEEQ